MQLNIRQFSRSVFPYLTVLVIQFTSCRPGLSLRHVGQAATEVTGTFFYKKAVASNWKQRDSLFLFYFNQGNVPNLFYRFRPIRLNHKDSLGKMHAITFYCSPDYAMIGTNDDWVRVPLTPIAAQAMADSMHCFLPTRKMVDLIHHHSKVKLEPVPMYAYRDSTVTMWQHHLIIEGQRKGKKGLVSGIKKDIVICSEDAFKGRQQRVAIYGWHKADGKPIQPLYTGHVNWYADYSHGARMIYSKIKVDRQWKHYSEVLNDPLLLSALNDEQGKLMLRY